VGINSRRTSIAGAVKIGKRTVVEVLKKHISASEAS
jgi:hypothetical protein